LAQKKLVCVEGGVGRLLFHVCTAFISKWIVALHGAREPGYQQLPIIEVIQLKALLINSHKLAL
jgi:hypothetical protein